MSYEQEIALLTIERNRQQQQLQDNLIVLRRQFVQWQTAKDKLLSLQESMSFSLTKARQLKNEVNTLAVHIGLKPI